MDALLDHGFTGVDALREQWLQATVHSSCHCGCGSFGFDLCPGAGLPRSAADSPLPIHITVMDDSGEVVGGIAVLLQDGYLYDVDVYSFGEAPIAVPRLENVRWTP
jgi:hypothetical protein